MQSESSIPKEKEILTRDTGIRINGVAVTYEYNRYSQYNSLYREFQTKIEKHHCCSCNYVRSSKLYVFCTVDKDEDGSTHEAHSLYEKWHMRERLISPSSSPYFPDSFKSIFGIDIAVTLRRKVEGALQKAAPEIKATSKATRRGIPILGCPLILVITNKVMRDDGSHRRW